MKKDDQKTDQPEQDNHPELTMERFQEVVGKLMQASQRANWEKKEKAEKSLKKSDQVEPV